MRRQLRNIILLVVMFLAANYVVAQENKALLNFTSSNLPLIFINTNGQQIPDEPKIEVDLGIIYNGPGVRNYLTDTFNNYNGMAGIEIRGSSSQSFDKKSYGFETRDLAGNNNNVSLLGLPSENDWILYAPYSDKSLLRNVLTFDLGSRLGRYAPRTVFCELFINGEYMGVYVLMEKIKQDDNRVDIADLLSTDIDGDELTGGYIIKIDKLTGGGEGWESAYAPYAGAWQRTKFLYHYPDYTDIVFAQKNYIEDFITEFETSLTYSNFADPIVGYRQYADVGSFIDFMIINEVGNNVDGYRLSTFMYKDKNSNYDKLVMGPLWDFNLAFGNANYCDGGNIDTWAYNFNIVCGGDSHQIPFWWERLRQDTTFVNETKCRWESLRLGPLHTDSVMEIIDNYVSYLDESQERNFEKWDVLDNYVWPNQFVGQNYQEEIYYLKTWTTERLLWIDNNLSGTCYPATNIDDILTESDIIVYPNPFSDVVNFSITLESSADISINVTNILGNVVRTINIGKVNSGEVQYSWDGKNSGGNNLSPGIYIYNIYANNVTVSKGKIIRN